MFDCVSSTYSTPILSPPHDTINVGTDLKPALLAKAAFLSLYDRLVRHDNNEPLPFDNDAFQTVYCNAAYWVANIEGFLCELRRITRPGGRIILQVKLESIRRYTLEGFRDVLGNRVLDIIGRSRFESWPTLTSRSSWEARFTAAGLVINSTVPFITKTHAHIWDIGLRPIAPMLIKMANSLAPSTRTAIKHDWVDLLFELLMPLCDPNLKLVDGEGEPAEVQYVLTPT